MSVGHPALVVIGLFLAYTLLVGTLWKLNRVDYTTLAESRETMIRGIVLPIGAGAALVAVAVTVLGAWHASVVEQSNRAPGWVIVVPILMAVVAFGNASRIDYRMPGNALPWLALGTLLVGFSEEMVTRGVMIVGLREAGWSELQVYLVCTALFGLLHGINALFGQSLQQTIVQVAMAFFAGTAFYLTRMATGSLLVGMVVHAAWDFGTLGLVHTKREQTPVVGLIAFGTFALSMIAVWFVVL